MSQTFLGRTNQAFPPIWLKLAAPAGSSEAALRGLADSALRADTVLDISTSPALWGGLLRGSGSQLMFVGGHDTASATGASHAADLIRALILQTLCAIGRERLDFFFLRLPPGLEEAQMEGALVAMEEARQEGHLGFLGAAVERCEDRTMSSLLRHDAFELFLLPERSLPFEALASERRVGIVWREDVGLVPRLAEVNTAVAVAMASSFAAAGAAR